MPFLAARRAAMLWLIAIALAGCARERNLPRIASGTWTETRDGDRVHLQAALPATPYPWLVLRAYIGEFTVRIDGRPVYAFHDRASDCRLTLHVVPLTAGGLKPAASPRMIEIDVPRAAPDATLFGGEPRLATNATLPFALVAVSLDPLRDDLTDLLLGFILMVVGVIALAASAIRRRGDPLTIRAFGLFTLLYGLRLLVDSYFPILLGASLLTLEYAQAFITYVITIPGWLLPVRLMGRGWKSSLHWQVVAFAVFAPIGIASDLITRTPGSLEVVNNVLVVLGGINIIANLLRAEHRRTAELRVVLAGAMIFLLFALNNNLTALRILPWRFSDETLGFVVFVATLGYAATRAFLRGERDRLSLDNELRTAREIQLAILPTSMPLVEGARFDAAYDPASSVAGDLYDFLTPSATKTGVLVADVAGHGVPAALIASMVKIAVAAQSKLADDPAALLRELNATLRREVRRAFVTATVLWLDMEHRRVTVCNAGHPPPLLYRDGVWRDLGPHGVLLGRFARVDYTAATVDLAAADRIVAYTDGIVEARNARDEQFGEERLKEAVARGGSAQEVFAAVHAWRGEATEDADDLTIVIVDIA